jgi:hypothetical protein
MMSDAAKPILIAAALMEVQEEIADARMKHAPMRGAHEGYAILLEEVDEL